MMKSIRYILILMILIGITSAILAETKAKPDSKAILGKIEEKTYTYGEYNNILNNYYKYWAARDGKALTEDRKKQLNDQCWEEQVGMYIYDREIKRRKLGISDQEAYNAAISNPPQDVKNIEALKENGKFSLERFKTAMEKDATFKKNVIDFMRNGMKYDRLLNSIKSEVKIKPDSVKQAWMKENNSVSGKVIVFDYTKVKGITVSDSEMVAYYNQNLQTYKRDPARRFKYVRFSNDITSADSVYARAKADSLYKVITAGADFAELAKQFSADPGSGQKGGDLDWFGKGRMVKPFEEKAFALNKMEVGEPVQSQFGWHIIQTMDKRTNDKGEEEVNARHILIKPVAGEETVKRSKVLAEKLQTLMSEKGIDAAAAELNVKVEETAEFYEKSKSIPILGSQPDLQKAAFSNPVGYIPAPIKGRQGETYVCQLSDSLDFHYSEFENEKSGIKSKLETEKKKTGNKKLAHIFYDHYRGQDYIAAAAADSMKIVEVKDVKAGAYITDVGNYPAVNDSLLAHDANQYTGIIETDNNCYLGFVTIRNRPDMKKWEKEKTTIINAAKEKEKTNHLNKWYADVHGKLKIEDNRKNFYELKTQQGNQQIKLMPN